MTATAERALVTAIAPDLSATAVRENLVAALKFVTLAIAKRSPVPVLSGVLIEGHGDHLTMAGFDFELAIRETVAGTGTGRVLVPGHFLLGLLKDGEKGGLVDLSVHGDHLVVVSDGVTYKQQWLPIEDYPALPPTGEVAVGALSAEVVKRLPDVCHAAGSDDTLPILTAVFFDNSGGELTLAATDRYRLATLAAGTPGDRSALVPHKYVEMVAKHLSGPVLVAGTQVNGTTARWVTFTDSAGRSFTVQELEGEFPKYRSLIPSTFTAWMTVNTAALDKAVGQVAKVLERNAPVTLEATAGAVTVHARAGEERSAQKRVDAIVREEITIGFNPTYLLQLLKAMGETATAQFTSPVKPSLWISGSKPGLQVLLMPVRNAEV